MKNASKKRLAIMFLVLVIGLMLLSLTAEAAFKDKARDSWAKTKNGIHKAWSHISNYVRSGAFWINAILITILAIVLLVFFLSDKLSDNSTKTLIYVLIGIIAIVLSTHIIDNRGNPTYLWKQEQFRQATQFFIGPTNAMGRCPVDVFLGSETLGTIVGFGRDVVGLGGEPPCCGTGAYEKFYPETNTKQCKQAVLRINENGAGLPALIVATIIFFVLFKWLMKDTERKYLLSMAIVLAALLANERVTKNQILVIVGWVVLGIFGPKLAKLMGKVKEEGDEQSSGSFAGKTFGLAIVYAGVQTALGLLGTSLWGGTVPASGFGTPTLFKHLLFGSGIGAVYALMTGDAMKDYFAKMSKAKKEEVERQIGEGNYGRALVSALPFGTKALQAYDKTKEIIKNFLGIEELEKEAEQKISLIEQIVNRRDQLNEEILKELTKPPQEWDRKKISELRRVVSELDKEIEHQARNAQRRYRELEKIRL